jgi:hypothetical protein
MRETALTLRILRGVSNARNAIKCAKCRPGQWPGDRAARTRVVQLTVTSYNVIQYRLQWLPWRVYKLSADNDHRLR